MKSRILTALVLSLSFIPLTSQAEPMKFIFGSDVAQNIVKIEIPAPLETTKAQLENVRGEINLDVADPMKTTGTIEADLKGIKSFSFMDPEKNSTQTEHMHNWFEIGGDVSEAVREKNRWAKFAITKIVKVEPTKVTDSPISSDEIGSGRRFHIVAEGNFTVHGITKPKTVDLDAVLYDVNPNGTRYKETEKVLMLRTRTPFIVSLKEHDVKPRDTTGKFLSGALQVVGLKLSDDAQVSLDLRAYLPKKK